MTEKPKHIRRKTSTYGLKKAESLVSAEIRRGAESRGFAAARLLTHWNEVVGEDLAALCRPEGVSWARGGMGATLTVLARGAEAPVVAAESERLRQRVNACYGYNAIVRVRVTQTSASGFAEGATPFTPAPKQPKGPAQKAVAAGATLAQDVADPGLRAALASLGGWVFERADQAKEGKS